MLSLNLTKLNITGFGSVVMATLYAISAGESLQSPAVQHAGTFYNYLHHSDLTSTGAVSQLPVARSENSSV